MAFKLNKIALDIRPGKITFPDGSELNFKYRPSSYTPEHEDKVELAREDNKAGSTLKAWLIPLLTEWDVVDEEIDADGQVKEIPVPISEEGFQHIPLQILGEIMTFISGDMSSKEAKASPSSGSFS